MDLKAFAIFAIAWSLFLLTVALFVDGDFMLADPLHAIVRATFFNFENERIVLLLEAGIFWVIGAGILAEQAWSVVFALIYMAQIVAGHLAFAITYLPVRFELSHVREVATQGPVLVLITLYLWIRASDLIFEAPATPARERDALGAKDRVAAHANHRTNELGAIAGSQK
ncbi:hypothetical protein [Candidatus Binatus sp.]|uniref:hypothetical protein n=1 Tax=Candidatus Binatus sp. TaxID=2811406 RepID=UPI002729A001|nr:hypothetical protein [Candidatus Binatus sp.]